MTFSIRDLMIMVLNGVVLVGWFLYLTAGRSYWVVLPYVAGIGGTFMIVSLFDRIAKYQQAPESRRLKYSLQSLLLVALAGPPVLALMFFSRSYWSLEMIPIES